MSQEHDRAGDKPALMRKSMEIGVSIVTALFGAVVIFDSQRLGAGWSSDGPQAGYFPFYIGLFIVIASLVNLWRAIQMPNKQVFLTQGQGKLVLSVLLPLVIYVLLIQFLGIYVASIIYIVAFMVWLGKYSYAKSFAVGFGVALVFFLMFEKWFKVPLIKGPIETLLGLN